MSSKYLSLYLSLRKAIIEEVWPCGARLPSRRQLALEHQLSVITVEHSLEMLCQEGYIEARPRSGYFVIYRASDGFAGTEVDGPAPVMPERDARSDETFPFSALARTMRRVLSSEGEAILNKSPNKGCLKLREALSGYLARNRGISVTPEQIVIGSGAEALYGMIVEMLGRDLVYGIESPSYEKIEQVYRAKGVQVELLALGRDGIQSSALARTRATVLHITPFRSFPSGVTATASKRAEYLRWAREDRFLVEDDFESEFSLLRKPEETVYARAEQENVIYLNTFSRTISSSLRVGYMVLPEKLLSRFDQTVGFYSCTVPSFEQYVLSEILRCGDFERHINRMRRRRRLEAESGEI